jgi:ketosteroid isomerase-like protein
MQSRIEILKRAYEAFNARDIDAVLATMQADVDWPNGMEGGRVFGQANVREYWRRQWEVVDPSVEPRRFEDDESGRIVVHVHQVVRDRAGTVLVDQMVHHAYSFRDGLIDRMDILEAEQDQEPGSPA